MKKISKFDLGVIVAFVLITLLGIGVWYYFSGQLDATKSEVSAAVSDFEKYTKHQPYLPTRANEKTLQANIDLMQGQIDPIVQKKLQASGNKLGTAVKEDTVAWKHDLDAEMSRLNNAARLHGVTVPNNFYFGFSKFLNENPSEDQTAVLTKQLLGVEELATIFINANVKAIGTFRRTYEEEPGAAGSAKTDPDSLPGSAVVASGNTYIAYPFEIEFECSPASLRKIVNALGASPYVFIIRSVTVQNSALASPQVGDLQRMAGTTPGGVLEQGPGTVSSASKAPRGPQFLFGNEDIHVKMRIDMIEWRGMADLDATAPAGPGGNRHRGGGNNRGDN